MKTKTTFLCTLFIFAFTATASALPDDKLVKISKKRIPMDKRLLTLCVGPGAVVGPHAVAEVDIYTNEITLNYRKENPGKHDYPVGSIFVKKKYPGLGVENPDIATVMVRKDNKGKVSDWEFSMESLPDQKPIRPKGRISCADCHEKYEDTGFVSSVSEKVFQEYLKLPSPVAQKNATPQNNKTGLIKRLAKLTYIYSGDQTPAEYIKSHPCVVGGWAYQGETDSHWIGDVHYISDNTLRTGIRYVAFRLKVKKTDKVKIDPKKWRGRILLQKANAKASIDERDGKMSDFTLIGYDETPAGGDGIFDLFEILPYKPAK